MEVHTKQLANLSYTKRRNNKLILFSFYVNSSKFNYECERTSRNLHLPLIDW